MLVWKLFPCRRHKTDGRVPHRYLTTVYIKREPDIFVPLTVFENRTIRFRPISFQHLWARPQRTTTSFIRIPSPFFRTRSPAVLKRLKLSVERCRVLRVFPAPMKQKDSNRSEPKSFFSWIRVGPVKNCYFRALKIRLLNCQSRSSIQFIPDRTAWSNGFQ